MKYCKRCVNPENIYGGITFDEDGVCSRCRAWEEYEKDFNDTKKREAKEKAFIEILERYRDKSGNNYDMIIPVSGGKDSLYQVHLLKKVYGFNPLLVTFNHTFNTKTGIFNLTNMVEKLGVDHIRFTPNPKIISKLARLSLRKFGDICWHCHCGIFTFPLRVAVAFKIPLLICQEAPYSLLSAEGGFYTKVNPDHRRFSIRAEAEEMVNEEMGINRKDLVQWRRPPQEEIDRIGVRGINIVDFIMWDSKAITEFLIKEYDFKTKGHDRTYDCYANAECHHCSGVHDYLRYLKVGHGRATDDVGIDIRKGLMTREEGIDLVEKYDSKRPKDLDILIDRVGITEDEIIKSIDHHRDARAWEKTADGKWKEKDSVINHKSDQGIDKARISLREKDGYKRKDNPIDGETDEYVIM